MSFIRQNPWYVVFFLAGFVCCLPYSVQEVHDALYNTGTLMLVALFASLLVAFAGFTVDEALNKFWLQNAPLAAFGAYAYEVVMIPTAIKIVLTVCAMGMHLSYWNSGIHSRAYRFDQLRYSGLATQEEIQQICRLNANGRSGDGDKIVQRLLALPPESGQ